MIFKQFYTNIQFGNIKLSHRAFQETNAISVPHADVSFCARTWLAFHLREGLGICETWKEFCDHLKQRQKDCIFQMFVFN